MRTETITAPATQQLSVELSKIVFSETNKNFTRPVTDDFLASIRNQGVLQPVLLRPLPGGKFECVCGERRVRAAKANNFVHIPAQVKTLNDQDALDAQASENINREDLTPFQEGKLFKVLYESLSLKAGTKEDAFKELSRRVGRNPAYIAQRIKLNDLIPEIAKLLDHGEIMIGHAEIACRLSLEDQKDAFKNCLSRDWDRMSVKNFERRVNEDYLLNLSGAPWKKDDATLVPAAGSCNACPKRSGANPLLFGDVKGKDNCLDGSCFMKKLAAHIVSQVKDLVEKKPDVIFLREAYGEDPHKDILTFLSTNRIKVYKNHSDFSTYKSDYDGKKTELKGFWLNGDNSGKIQSVYIAAKKAAAADPKKSAAASTQAAIAGIRERATRAAELDEEKVFVSTLEKLKSNPAVKKDGNLKETAVDRLLIRFLVIGAGDSYHGREAAKHFGLNTDVRSIDGSGSFLDKLAKLDDKKFLQLARVIMHKKAGQATDIHKPIGQLLRRMAVAYGVDVEKLDKEQATVRLKREERAKARIAELKTNKPVKK
jgi:ParB/RepB/Spo0J family partition protein